jgi:hypothetical protein
MSSGVVTFNWAVWVVQFPELGYVTQPQGQSFFNRATLLVDNTPTSPIDSLVERTILLDLATAHIASLSSSPNGQGPRGIVGRINNASEGSVSVQNEYVVPKTDSQAFWNQTQYGAEYWVASLKFRQGRFIPPPRGVNGNPGFGFFAGGPLGGNRRF